MIKMEDRTLMGRFKKLLNTVITWARPYLTLAKYFFKAFIKCHKKTYRESAWYKKLLIIFLEFLLALFLFLFCVDINFLWLFGKSPSMLTISDPQQSEASEVYSADGKLIGKYFKENRTPVDYDEIAPILIKTTGLYGR